MTLRNKQTEFVLSNNSKIYDFVFLTGIENFLSVCVLFFPFLSVITSHECLEVSKI